MEVTRLGEDTIVEIVCRLKGGGKQARRKRSKPQARKDQSKSPRKNRSTSKSGAPGEQQRDDDLDVGRNPRQSQAHWKHDMERTLLKYRTASHEVLRL